MIQFNQDICQNLDAALRREWLETNGLGGFASSTIVGLNTRRYHGLLVAATTPPVGREVLLSKLEETLLIDDRAFDLCANRYPGVVHPQGYQFLKDFRLDPFPVFTFEIEGIEIKKSVFMIHGENSTVVQYDVRKADQSQTPRMLRLDIRPLIAFRDYHSTTHENGSLNPAVQAQSGLASITPYSGLPTLHLAHNADIVQSGSGWYRNFEYEAERERGLDFSEDLFNPLLLQFDLTKQATATIIASTEPRNTDRATEYRQSEIERRAKTMRVSPINDEFAHALSSAADQYIVARGNLKTIIAGYHWFADWGRDTMIALHGLTLLTAKYEIARNILREFALHVDQGMLPNRFPDAGERPEYNTVDATLWYFEATRAYIAYTNDYDFVRKEMYSVLADIISWHVRGTRYNIKVDPSGLLTSGEQGVQLTWMDAKVGDWVVTPRRGKPVEIQALWYNALKIMEDLAQVFGDEPGRKRYRTMATLCQWSFNRLFWNENGGYLYDVVNGGPPDGSLRPNQILAVSLPYSMLPADRAKAVVEAVKTNLLTPFGLRSLAASDPQYRPRYSGGPTERDGAYHQGTVWAWLMGPFLTAYVKVNNHSDAARQQAAAWLSGFREHLSDAGLGQISEIFEAEAPHRPVGCVAQAWSVAEILRAYVEDIHGLRPTSRANLYAASSNSPMATSPPTSPSASALR